MKKIWQFFCSLHLSIYLGLGLCALLWVGSGYFLYSGRELATLNEEILIPWLWQRGWGGLATNWWLWLVLVVVLLLAINTLVCSIDRLIKLLPRLFAPKLDVKPQWLAGLAIKQELTLAAPLKEARVYLQRALKLKGFKKFRRLEQENGDWVIYVQKGRLVTLAPYLAHLGFLLVLAGHLLSSSSGFKSFGHWVGAGEKISLPHSSLWLRLEGIDPCSKQETDNYCSQVSLGEGEETLITSKMGMNNPLLYRGLSIYQANWEQEVKGIELTLTREGKSRQISLLPGEKRDIAPGIGILPYALLPDFGFSPQGDPISRSNVYNNPALLLIILQNGMPAKQGWLFLRKPKFQKQSYRGVEIKFSGLATNSVLLLNVTRNPGASTVLAGGVLFILAGAWVLLGNYRRLWFYLEKQEEGVRLLCGGMASQRQARLQAKMAGICEALEKRFS